MQGDQKEKLKALIKHELTRTEKLIVVLYYHEEMTMREIAAVLDMSEATVTQMHTLLLARLRADMR